jgi:hypothetical protein
LNATYFLLYIEAIDRFEGENVPRRARMMMRARSLVTLGLFVSAAVIALKHPIGGMTLICICLVVYLRPEAPNIKSRWHRAEMDRDLSIATGGLNKRRQSCEAHP